MYILISDKVLLLIVAASGFPEHFELCVLGHILGGCICSIALDDVVSAL